MDFFHLYSRFYDRAVLISLLRFIGDGKTKVIYLTHIAQANQPISKTVELRHIVKVISTTFRTAKSLHEYRAICSNSSKRSQFCYNLTLELEGSGNLRRADFTT